MRARACGVEVLYPAREHRPRAEKPRLPRLIVKPANEKGSILSAAKLSKLLAEYGAKAITKYNSDLTVIEVPLDCKLVTGAAHFLPEYRCMHLPRALHQLRRSLPTTMNLPTEIQN